MTIIRLQLLPTQELIVVDSFESPYLFERHSTHGHLTLNPLINDGQWGTVSEVGNEILPQLDKLLSPVLIVDLSRLPYIGSPQVALLVRIWKAFKRQQGRMVIVCPHPTVREVLVSAGLRKLWSLHDTIEDARETLGIQTEAAPRTSLWSWLSLGGLKPAPQTARAT